MSRTIRRERTKHFSTGCQSHGSCSYCADGRQHRSNRRAPAPEPLNTDADDVVAEQDDWMLEQEFLDQWEDLDG